MRFGTDGIRGPAGEPPVDRAGALAVGRAALAWAREVGGGSVAVGRDTRPSGAMLAAAVAEGVAGAGGHARDVGVLPSAGLASVLEVGLSTTGVMVTASHNPAADNGFKVLGPGGYKPDDAQTEALEAWLAAPAQVGRGHTSYDPEAVGHYLDAFVARVGSLELLAGRRILVDLANGAATATASALLSRLNLVVEVRGAGDGIINDGVGSEHLEGLQRAVVAGGYDAGLAVDGDADRAALVDDLGRRVPGDTLAWWLGCAMGAKHIAVTVMSNAALEEALPGVAVLRTPVGDRHLALAIRNEGCSMGAEESGHVLFADGLAGGDGLFTGLRGLAAAWSLDPRLSDASARFVPYPRALTKVRVTQRPPLDEVGPLARAVERGEAALGPGRVFLRYSGTEPVLRLLVEGRDADTVQAVSEHLTRLAAEVLG